MLKSAEHAKLSWAWKKFKVYKQNKFHAQLRSMKKVLKPRGLEWKDK